MNAHCIPPFAVISDGGNYDGAGRCWEKSNLRAMDLLLSSSDESLRFSLFGGLALTPRPEPLVSTFPSTSSRGREDVVFVAGFGNFEGCEG